MAPTDTLKRRLVEGAVDDNLDAMHGLVPRRLRAPRRLIALWGPRALIVAGAATALGGAHALLGREATPLPPLVAPATTLSVGRQALRVEPPQLIATRFAPPAPIRPCS